MRVGGNDNRYTMALGRRTSHVVQIKSRGMGVQLEALSMLHGRSKYFFQIDFVRFAPGQ